MPKEVPASQREVIEFCSNPNLINYCCLLMRPGLYSWMVQLEYLRFKPDTPANDGFHLTFCKWPEEDPIPALTIAVVSIDKSGQEFAESILWQHGLKRSPEGFAMMCFGPKGPEEFFLSGPRIYFLENHTKGAENVAYKNNPKMNEAAREHEKQLAEKYFQEHEAWLNTPEGKAIADAYWADKPTGYNR